MIAAKACPRRGEMSGTRRSPLLSTAESQSFYAVMPTDAARKRCASLVMSAERLMNVDRSDEADRNPSAMATVTLSCSP
jgi:hypothetical protein